MFSAPFKKNSLYHVFFRLLFPHQLPQLCSLLLAELHPVQLLHLDGPSSLTASVCLRVVPQPPHDFRVCIGGHQAAAAQPQGAEAESNQAGAGAELQDPEGGKGILH